MNHIFNYHDALLQQRIIGLIGVIIILIGLGYFELAAHKRRALVIGLVVIMIASCLVVLNVVRQLGGS